MDAKLKVGQGRAVADAIGERLRDMYDISEPIPDRLVALLNQIGRSQAIRNSKMRISNRTDRELETRTDRKLETSTGL